MKKRPLLLALLLLTCAVPFSVQAQSIVLRLQDGSEQAVLLSNLRKITFSDSNLVLCYNQGATQSYGVNTLSKLFFNTSGSPVQTTSAESVTFFYNAADQQIYFRNLPESESPVVVFRADGVSVVRTSVIGEESIDLSQLPAGFYLIKVNNQVYTFKK
jgi:hypothetical protein